MPRIIIRKQQSRGQGKFVLGLKGEEGVVCALERLLIGCRERATFSLCSLLRVPVFKRGLRSPYVCKNKEPKWNARACRLVFEQMMTKGRPAGCTDPTKNAGEISSPLRLLFKHR